VAIGPAELRHIAWLGRAFVSSVPEGPVFGSLRAEEDTAVRATSGGIERASFLRALNADVQLIAANTLFLVDGVADVLDAATLRNNEVHTLALNVVARSLTESAALAAWLLEREVTAEERTRRYVTWLFDDLAKRWSLTRDFGHATEAARTAAIRELEAEEQKLDVRVRSAAWRSRARKRNDAGGDAPSALLKDSGKGEAMPHVGAMVRDALPSASLYPLLSLAAHGSRVALRLSFDSGPSAEERNQVRYRGFGFTPRAVVTLTVDATLTTVKSMAAWTGVSAEPLLAYLRGVHPS
jgi:hypothetical protein